MLIKRRVENVAQNVRENGVAIRLCPNNDFGADIAAGAWPVLNDEILAEPLREPLPESRAMMSGALPGGNGTIICTGRDG